MRRYYLCPIIGDGSENNPYRPAIANDDENWGMIDLRPDSTKPDGLAIAYLDSDVAIARPGITLLTDDLSDKANSIKQTFNSMAKVNLTAETLPDLIAELLIAPQRPGFCKPIRPMRDGKNRLYLGGRIWGEPEPIYRKGSIHDDLNRDDAEDLGQSAEGWSWTEFNEDWDIESNKAVSYNSYAWSMARADSNMASDDHYAQAAVSVVDNDYACGVLVRKDSSATLTCYGIYVYTYSGTIRRVYIGKWVNGSKTTLGYGTMTYVAGKVVKGQADGSTITGFYDGEQVVQFTDTDITGNLRTGICAYRHSNTADDFEAGDLVEITEKSSSDSGGGVDAKVSYPAAAITKSDSGSGQEGSPTQTALLSKSETGLGADALVQLLAVLASSETGSGVEQSIVSLLLSVSDSGTGTDALAWLLAVLAKSDSGSGQEGSPTQTTSLSKSETGLGADALAQLLAVLASSETGSGVEQGGLSVIVAKFSSETGSGAEVAALIRVLVSSDGGVGSDLNKLIKDILGSDGGNGCEALKALVAAAGSSMRLTGSQGRVQRLSHQVRKPFKGVNI